MTIYIDQIKNNDQLYKTFSKIKGSTIITKNSKGKVIRLFSSNLPNLKVEKGSTANTLELEVESAESDDLRLLHRLLEISRV